MLATKNWRNSNSTINTDNNNEERTYQLSLIEKCLCGSTDFEQKIIFNLPILECRLCHVQHQKVDMTPQQYFDFYSQKYHNEFQQEKGVQPFEERYSHDYQIAQLRLQKYKRFMTQCQRALDIGSGNNAFVDLLNDNGYKAYGVELGTEALKHETTTYNKDLLDISFPPNYFDFITLHDVLEHFIDPVAYIKEIHKILGDDKYAVIDFPNFYEHAGMHHWKKTEHLWMMTDEQLKEFFIKHGFSVFAVDKPIPSKLVYYIKKVPTPQLQKKRLLFMPGMGDIYWPLTKMESFIKKNNLGVPECYIWDLDQKRIGNSQRSENFLNKFGFMEYKGTLNRRVTSTFPRFYQRTNGKMQWAIPAEGFDYVFNMNGMLEVGDNIVTDNGLNEYDTNWEPKMFQSKEQDQYEKAYREKYGKFIFGYFTGTGDYERHINKKITPEFVYRIAYNIWEKTGAKLVLTGTTWDVENSNRIKSYDRHNIIFSEINQTDTTQLFALMKASVGVFGWAAGNTIVAASVFKKPTVIVWSTNMLHEKFATNCIDPRTLNKTYFPFQIEKFGPYYHTIIDSIAPTLASAIEQKPLATIVNEPVIEQPEDNGVYTVSPEILICGRLGDVVAMDSWLTLEQKRQVRTIYYTLTETHRTLNQAININLIFPNAKRQIVIPRPWENDRHWFSEWMKPYGVVDNKYVNMGSALVAYNTGKGNVFDGSVTSVLAHIWKENPRIQQSSFISNTLATIDRFNLPPQYVVIHASSFRHAQKDFTGEDWSGVLEFLNSNNLQGVVIGTTQSNIGINTPVHDRLVNLIGKTNIAEGIEITKAATYFIGVASVFSIIASKVLPEDRVHIKANSELTYDGNVPDYRQHWYFFYNPLKTPSKFFCRSFSSLQYLNTQPIIRQQTTNIIPTVSHQHVPQKHLRPHEAPKTTDERNTPTQRDLRGK